MKKAIYKTIKSHELISGKTAVVLGLSGGPDSLALFDVLAGLAADYEKTKGKFGLNIKIYPVHVNHKFRPGDAENDQKFVEKYTAKVAKENPAVHKAKTFVVDCNELAAKEHLSSEEAGRKARYDAFGEVANKLLAKNKNVVIAVAQNANDQAETILFRIIRGTGIEGLSGIQFKRTMDVNGKTVQVIRPLLETTRDEIEAYIKKRKLKPCHDLTNDEAIFTRNKIRLELIPKLKEYNPNIVKTINRLGEIATLENDFMDTMTSAVISVAVTAPPEDLKKRLKELEPAIKPDKYLAYDCKILANIEKATRFRLYRKALASIGLTEDVSMKNLEAIDKIRTSQNHKLPKAEIRGDYTAVRIKGKLVFLSAKH